jgi:two-component system nitrate/nitrite response regulator NarL
MLSQSEPEKRRTGPAIDHRRHVTEESPSLRSSMRAKDEDSVTDTAPLYPTVLVGRSGLSLEGLARILEPSQFQVVARVTSADDLSPSEVQRHKAILLILDAGREIQAAARQVQSFKKLHAEACVAAVISGAETADMTLLLQAGANACFGQNVPVEVFLKSLELVMLGETLIPPSMLFGTREAVAQSPERPTDGRSRLSPQEMRILDSLVKGDPNKTIARKLGAAEATIKVHVKSILRKLGVANRTQAAMWAMRSDAREA